MGKIVFIDGSQGVGKSTLIEGVSTKTPVYVYKFPFSEYVETFSLNDKSSLKGFQLGKDLATIYFLSRAGLSSPWPQIVDRGPLSTVYYSLTTGRMTVQEVEDFFKILSKSSEPFSFIFIKARNQGEFTRNKNDGFDGLKVSEVNPELAVETIIDLAKKYRISLKVFENDFSKGIEENVSRFYKLVKEEL